MLHPAAGYYRAPSQDNALIDRRKTLAASSTGTHRPGVRVGSTSEFSLFFHVRPGHENDLREAVQALQNSPGYRPGDYELPIAVIHEARFVLFDGDTRLLFATMRLLRLRTRTLLPLMLLMTPSSRISVPERHTSQRQARPNRGAQPGRHNRG